MLPDRVSSPGPLAHESDALPTAVRGPAKKEVMLSEELLRVSVIFEIPFVYEILSAVFILRTLQQVVVLLLHLTRYDNIESKCTKFRWIASLKHFSKFAPRNSLASQRFNTALIYIYIYSQNIYTQKTTFL